MHDPREALDVLELQDEFSRLQVKVRMYPRLTF